MPTDSVTSEKDGNEDLRREESRAMDDGMSMRGKMAKTNAKDTIMKEGNECGLIISECQREMVIKRVLKIYRVYLTKAEAACSDQEPELKNPTEVMSLLN